MGRYFTIHSSARKKKIVIISNLNNVPNNERKRTHNLAQITLATDLNYGPCGSFRNRKWVLKYTQYRLREIATSLCWHNFRNVLLIFQGKKYGNSKCTSFSVHFQLSTWRQCCQFYTYLKFETSSKSAVSLTFVPLTSDRGVSQSFHLSLIFLFIFEYYQILKPCLHFQCGSPLPNVNNQVLRFRRLQQNRFPL